MLQPRREKPGLDLHPWKPQIGLGVQFLLLVLEVSFVVPLNSGEKKVNTKKGKGIFFCNAGSFPNLTLRPGLLGGKSTEFPTAELKALWGTTPQW